MNRIIVLGEHKKPLRKISLHSEVMLRMQVNLDLNFRVPVGYLGKSNRKSQERHSIMSGVLC